MTALEDRLRRELRAEGALIAPGSIIGLELPEDTRRLPGRRRRGGAPGWAGWVKPLAAAAAVAAVVAGTFAVVRAVPGAPAARPAPVRPALPAFYASTLAGNIYVSRNGRDSSGVDGRYLEIRATATGNLLATIDPPGRYNNFTVLSGAAGGHVFVAGARRIRDFAATSSPALAELDKSTPMRFTVVRVTPAGGVRVSRLSLPGHLTPAQRPSIALSPDGTRLAVAYGGSGQAAVVQVMTLATGTVRRWVQPHASWSPQVEGAGAWTADGRELAVVQEPGSGGPPVTSRSFRLPRTTRVRLLDTSAPGTSLTAGRLLVLLAPGGLPAPSQPYLAPDGSVLISPVMSGDGSYLARGQVTGGLAVYSAATGTLLRTLAPWVWRYPSPPGRGGFPHQVLAWSDLSGSRLVLLQPSHDLNILSALTGSTFAPAGHRLLPARSGAYQVLQRTLRRAYIVAW